MEQFVFENKHFRLTVGADAEAKSLISKCDGRECLANGLRMPLFSVTEDRPYNNEIKLTYMNQRSTFQANRIRREGDRLIVGFELVRFEAIIEVKVTDEYMAFTLVDFLADREDFPHHMDFPPVESFCLLQLPVDRALPYGQWLNVCHYDTAALAIVATDEYGFIEPSTLGNYRVISCNAKRKFHLRGCAAALICTKKNVFLDSIDKIEEDYDLPRSVKSRRNPLINASIYWTHQLNPENVDEHIAYAKKGGYRMMLLYYTCMAAYGHGYGSCGDYTYKACYPNGDADMRAVLKKIKDAGITPGLHVLHTHIGFETKYVTPRADHRLHLTDRFTLSRPLTENDDTVYVEECPIDAPMMIDCRVLRFDGELIKYESYSTEQPYCFKGCQRGYLNTEITEHARGCSGGVLHVSEYGATSAYIDQDSSLQDEVAEKIAHLYDQGFEFLYYDGSEGVQDPFAFHISNAQYRVYKHLSTPPVLCEGAAKSHFDWHILSGANAFDIFPTPIFKEKILEFPFYEAKLMKLDFSRVNFGWWKFYADTRVDVHEFGTCKAAAWDCPVTVQIKLENFKANPRTDDILEMMARWEDVRVRRWLTTEQKEEIIRDERQEFTLLQTGNGEYELLPYEQVTFETYQGITAFVFERNNEAHVVLWDDLGSSRVTLATEDLCDVSTSLGGYSPIVKQGNGKTVLTLSRRAYFKTTAGREVLCQWLKNAIVERN